MSSHPALSGEGDPNLRVYGYAGQSYTDTLTGNVWARPEQSPPGTTGWTIIDDGGGEEDKKYLHRDGSGNTPEQSDKFVENILTGRIGPDQLTDDPAEQAGILEKLGAETPAGAQAKVDASLAATGLTSALTAGKLAVTRVIGDRADSAVGVSVGAMKPLVDSAVGGTDASYGEVTLTDSTWIITTSSAHGLQVGDVVQFGTIRTISSGVTAGANYYVKTVPSSTTLTVSTTPSGPTLGWSGGSGTADNFYKVYVGWDRQASTPGAAMRYTGSTISQADGSFPRYDHATSNPDQLTYAPGAKTGPLMTVETETDGAAIDIILRNSNVTEGPRIYVDGRLVKSVTSTDFSDASVSGGARARLPLTFEDARKRVIRIEFLSASDEFPGFQTAGASCTYPVTVPQGPLVLLVGDSFVEGTNSTAASPSLWSWTSWAMGWPDLRRCGSGGTGYTEAGSRTALVDRYENDIIDQLTRPGIVIIAMGINDAVDYAADPTTVKAAWEEVWDAVLDADNCVQLIIVGPWPNNGGNSSISATLVAMDAAMRSSAAERGLLYFSPISDGLKYTVTDGTHPAAEEYRDVLAPWLVGRLKTALP